MKEKIKYEVLKLVGDERERQDRKWGEQNHDLPLWVGILGEEYGEFCQAVNETVFDNGTEEYKKGGMDNIVKELTQVAAVAIACLECIKRNQVSREV
ncbi:MAG: MazG-like family protein [Endomicrobium sp.]|jgi:hypothetical protein|nr:MazG-like family protein [Endomicrobium sp.]